MERFFNQQINIPDYLPEAKVEFDSKFSDFIPPEFLKNPFSYFNGQGKNIKLGNTKYNEAGVVREDPNAVKDLPSWKSTKGEELLVVGKKVNTAKGEIRDSNDPFYEYHLLEKLSQMGLPAARPIAKAEQANNYLIIMERIPGIRWSEKDIFNSDNNHFSEKDAAALTAEAEQKMNELKIKFDQAGVIRPWKLKDMVFNVDFENKKIISLVPTDWERTKIIETEKPNFEVMPMPEIISQEERGLKLLTIILKFLHQELEKDESLLTKKVITHFQASSSDKEAAKKIEELLQTGVDEESLYNLALTYQRPERTEQILETAKKYKPQIKNASKIQQDVLSVLAQFDQSFSGSQLDQALATEIEQEKNERLKELKETEEKIKNLIDFFKPDAKTTTTKKINFTPLGSLTKENSGRNFSLANEQIIISPLHNFSNQEHEFSHGIINPIVEKLSLALNANQKETISKLASGKLKQDYGSNHFSLLCEELIRTQIELIAKGVKPQTDEDFHQKISNMTEEEFQGFLQESFSLKKRCELLNIKTINDFQNKSREYFDQFEKNELRGLIFNFYQDYLKRPEKETENFEQFVLKELPKRL